MSSLNRVTLVGHVGSDPDIRNTQQGKKIVNMSIATSEKWKDRQSGEMKKQTEWHRVVIFNDGLADVIEKYVTKGSKLLIEGKLKTRKWSDQSGQTKYATEVVVEKFGGQMLILGDGPQGNNNHQSDSAGYNNYQQATDFDEEIPF